MEDILAIITVIAICSICLVIILCLKIEEMQKDKEKILADKQNIEADLWFLKIMYKDLKHKRNNNVFTSAIDDIPKDTLDAVKYAMNKAHPDNGGDAEKFIKYKKCYDELRKGEK